jgi:hypothetical protein
LKKERVQYRNTPPESNIAYILTIAMPNTLYIVNENIIKEISPNIVSKWENISRNETKPFFSNSPKSVRASVQNFKHCYLFRNVYWNSGVIKYKQIDAMPLLNMKAMQYYKRGFAC